MTEDLRERHKTVTFIQVGQGVSCPLLTIIGELLMSIRPPSNLSKAVVKNMNSGMLHHAAVSLALSEDDSSASSQMKKKHIRMSPNATPRRRAPLKRSNY